MTETQCPPPTVNFTVDGKQETIILDIKNIKELENIKLKSLFEATEKSTAIKKSKSKTNKLLRNTLCKVNIHNIDGTRPYYGVCLNCGKITKLNNVSIKFS